MYDRSEKKKKRIKHNEMCDSGELGHLMFLSSLLILSHLNSPTTLWDKHYDYAHFTDVDLDILEG